MTDTDTSTDTDNAPSQTPSRWRRRWQSFKETVVVWRAPGIAGLIGTAGSWTVWYYSKVPCIAETAAAGLCNPGVVASYITLPALTSCLGIGAGFATLTGGYNIVMLNKERQRADDAEVRAIKAQERADQVADDFRQLYRRVIEEQLEERQEERRRAEEIHQVMLATMEEQRLRAEEERLRTQEERRRAEEERQRAQDERQQSAEAHQAMMAAIARLAPQRNGERDRDRDNENGSGNGNGNGSNADRNDAN